MAFGVELATAFIHVVPSFSGIGAAMDRGFAPGAIAAEKAGIDSGKKFTSGAAGEIKKLAATIGIAFVAKQIADGFSAAVTAARDLKEAGTATAVIFGDSFEQVERWTKTAATAFGQSQRQALDAAKTFGIFGQAAGLAGDANVEFSTGMAELASDLASFHNTSPEEAIIALGAALRGENEPIRRFGVLLDDATLRNKALQLGLITTTKDALTPQQKVLAAHAAILEQTSFAQGDFQRTSEGLANQQRTIAARWEDITAQIGEAFIPVLEDLTREIIDNVLPAFEDFLGFLGDIKEQDWFQGLLDALAEGGELDLVGGGFVETFKKRFGEELPGSFEHGWEQIKQANRDATEELPKAFEDSWNNRWLPAAENGFTQLHEIFRQGDEDITSAFSHGWQQITDWWNTGWGVNFPAALANGREQINTGVTWLWEQITGAFANGWTQITTWWGDTWTSVWTTLDSWRQTIVSTVTTFIRGLVDNFSHGWEQITSFFRDSARTIGDIVNGVLDTFEHVAQGIRNAFDGIGQFIRDAFGPVGDFLGGVASTFSNLFGGIGDQARHFKGRLSAIGEQRRGAGGSFAGGATLARVQALLGRFPGLHITDTLSSPARDAAFGIVRSPGSYHYDANNPAVDVAGPIPQLHAFANMLYAIGGWRQILWQVAGHYDHVHVAHSGGVVDPSWPRMLGDKPDERTIRAQVGETILPRGYEPVAVQAWEPPRRRRRGEGEGRDRAAVEIRGDVYTTDLDEFIDRVERAKRRAYALTAPALG